MVYKSNNHIYHYGVLGMRWGAKRNASKAYTKAVNKKNKIDQRVNSIRLKSAKLQVKATKKLSRATSKSVQKKGFDMQFEANKLNMKSARLERKGLKWVKEMDKTFGGYDVQKVPRSTKLRGKKFVYEVIQKSS